MPSRPTYVVRAQTTVVAAGVRGSATSVAVHEPPSAPAPSARPAAPAVARGAAKAAPAEPVLPLSMAALGLERRPGRSAHAREGPGEHKPDGASRRKPASHARSSSPLRRALQLLATVVIGAGGVAAAHYAMMNGWIAPFSVHPAVQPVDPRLAGGLLGVMLAWLVVRWTSPRR